ncbi:hypothetical protein [Streptomyces sp. H51]|uniref:hypothetical protein n=1 Tax=Streptomyces sp. H51 TaxID=3111770 RepID=UPI002D796E4E|nr:hypothetical protein [Streptomyces sp. H51]
MSSFPPEASALHEFLVTGNEPRYQWPAFMTAEPWIGGNTRIRVRPRLTAVRWPGNIDAAARVAAMLADNAFVHAKPLDGNVIGIRLVWPQDSDDLVIEVDDAVPDFPGFDKVSTPPTQGGKPHGLWWVHHYRGCLAWCIKRNDEGEPIGKTVQVILPTSWGE